MRRTAGSLLGDVAEVERLVAAHPWFPPDEESFTVLRRLVGLFDARATLSQDKPPAVVSEIIARLDGGGTYASAGLATETRRHHDPA